MKYITVIMIFSVFLSPCFASNEIKYSIHPYAAYYDFDKTVSKKSTAAGGVYGFYKYGDYHSFEGDIGYTRITYKGTLAASDFDIEQKDLTLVYNNNYFSDLKARTGVHAIVSDDDQTDKSYIVFTGVSYYELYKYDMGVDVYVSSYKDYVPDSLTVLQLTATGGFNFGDYYTTGSFYARTRCHYIRLSDDIGYNDKQFTSVEQALFYYYKEWTVQAFAWVGSQVFSVQKDGFVVHNLGEKHMAEYGGSVTYAYNKSSSVKLEVSRGNFKELGYNTTAHFLKCMAMMSFKF